MTDWKKISLILGSIVALTVIISFGYNAIGSGYQLKKNSENVPALNEKVDAHIASDNIAFVNFTNAINNLSKEMTDLKEALKENTRSRQWEKFNQRK